MAAPEVGWVGQALLKAIATAPADGVEKLGYLVQGWGGPGVAAELLNALRDAGVETTVAARAAGKRVMSPAQKEASTKGLAAAAAKRAPAAPPAPVELEELLSFDNLLE